RVRARLKLGAHALNRNAFHCQSGTYPLRDSFRVVFRVLRAIHCGSDHASTSFDSHVSECSAHRVSLSPSAENNSGLTNGAGSGTSLSTMNACSSPGAHSDGVTFQTPGPRRSRPKCSIVPQALTPGAISSSWPLG